MKLTAELLVDLVTHFDNEDEKLQRQLIINTHSPVLVGDIFSLNKNNVYRVWLSQMVTQIKKIGDRKQKIQTTKILPVIKGDIQLAIQFTEEERKLTLANLTSYLNTANPEKEELIDA